MTILLSKKARKRMKKLNRELIKNPDIVIDKFNKKFLKKELKNHLEIKQIKNGKILWDMNYINRVIPKSRMEDFWDYVAEYLSGNVKLVKKAENWYDWKFIRPKRKK